MTNSNKKVDVLSNSSEKTGISWLFETILRRYRSLSFMLLFGMITFLVSFSVGISLMPGIALFIQVYEKTSELFWPIQAFCLGMTIPLVFILFTLSIIFVIPLMNFIVPFKLKAGRGPIFSNESIGWYIHNALTYIVRYTVLDFITPSPLNVLFYKMMGMKIGKGVTINTSNISDPCLITLDDYVSIGGSTTMIAHYAQKGFIIFAPIHIKKGATIGLKSSIMGDVIIGKKVTIQAHSLITPKTRIPDSE